MSNNRHPATLAILIIAAVIIIIGAIVIWFKSNNVDAEFSQSASNTVDNDPSVNSRSAPDMSNPYKGLDASPAQNKAKFTTEPKSSSPSLPEVEVDEESVINED
ncbi:hypothetical protein [Psychrobacter sp. LV10R520-6]|uniref:hypothetical protein n=1 Tax=Psychrobacter sp. LV10R520-6 TaxID=1415574 RepID=UPI0024C59603|nr:hypothetical protein [Psychrobacter sp. LV10R520-6]SNT69067.1 hypothetical protein SAMN04488491_0119 [Psychrobacter sp. LV10R520-6]